MDNLMGKYNPTRKSQIQTLLKFVIEYDKKFKLIEASSNNDAYRQTYKLIKDNPKTKKINLYKVEATVPINVKEYRGLLEEQDTEVN